jgi:hypothetical protein
VRRQARSGAVVGPDERVPAAVALAAYAGPPVRVGALADLVLRAADGTVRTVWLGGRGIVGPDG